MNEVIGFGVYSITLVVCGMLFMYRDPNKRLNRPGPTTYNDDDAHTRKEENDETS